MRRCLPGWNGVRQGRMPLSGRGVVRTARHDDHDDRGAHDDQYHEYDHKYNHEHDLDHVDDYGGPDHDDRRPNNHDRGADHDDDSVSDHDHHGGADNHHVYDNVDHHDRGAHNHDHNLDDSVAGDDHDPGPGCHRDRGVDRGRPDDQSRDLRRHSVPL